MYEHRLEEVIYITVQLLGLTSIAIYHIFINFIKGLSCRTSLKSGAYIFDL